MKVAGQHYQTIWLDRENSKVFFIDQTLLPFEFSIKSTSHHEVLINAIKTMQVRGAPVIGITGALALLLGMSTDCSDENLNNLSQEIIKARPTAVNLAWAVNSMNEEIQKISQERRLDFAWNYAEKLIQNDIQCNHEIGVHGGQLIIDNNFNNILTHCNAGWLATINWGTATSPIYHAHKKGIPVHVWADETRPRNQGANLTSYELNEEGIKNTIISDNTGGILMQRGQVDMCIVGTDRTLSNGDVCNKIGTYLKALAAHDNGIPFYAAVPSPTIDWSCRDGRKDIPIEERSAEEVLFITGALDNGQTVKVRIAPEGNKSANPAFDVTPHRLVTGIITDRGVCEADESSLLELYPEQRSSAMA